jgi:hypothetical protein
MSRIVTLAVTAQSEAGENVLRLICTSLARLASYLIGNLKFVQLISTLASCARLLVGPAGYISLYTMRLITASRVLTVSLLIGVVTAKSRNHLQVGLLNSNGHAYKQLGGLHLTCLWT